MLRQLLDWLVDLLIARALRDPYCHLPGYMLRYWLIRPRWWLPLSVRIHMILRSDSDRHMHDHPWANLSLILRGWYIEELPESQQQAAADDLRGKIRERVLVAGDVVFRRANDRHRLQLMAPCWTLFVMFGRQRHWGFHTEKGWVYWRQYLNDWTTQTVNEEA